MDFAHPTWWALAGLAVPLIIHLLSKREKHVVAFGSIRFLDDLGSESARSIQLSQYGLLFLRLLIVGVVGALIAQPLLHQDEEQLRYYIQESIYNSDDHQGLVSTLPQEAEVQLFSISPSAEDDVIHVPSLWTLIDLLNDDAQQTVVYSHSLYKDFIGPVVLLDQHIDWRVIPLKQSETATQVISNDRHQLGWKIESEEKKLSVSTISEEGATSQPSRPMRIHLLSSDEEQADRFQRLLALTQEFLVYDIEITTASSAQSDIVVAIDTAIAYDQVINWTTDGSLLQVDRPDETTLDIAGDIDRENIIDTNLPVILASFFNTRYTDIYDNDLRVLDPSIQHLATPSVDIVTASLGSRSLSLELLALLALLIICERVYAYKFSDPS